MNPNEERALEALETIDRLMQERQSKGQAKTARDRSNHKSRAASKDIIIVREVEEARDENHSQGTLQGTHVSKLTEKTSRGDLDRFD